jgi:outer membrane protein TolC
VTGTYNRGGRGGEHQEVFRGIRDRQDSVWSVGVQGQVPLGNRQARGSYRRRQLEVREAEQRLAKTQQDIVLNVRFAMRQAATSRILVESNRQARALQETNVAAEEKRQKLGASTSFEVLRTQEDLTQAQVNEVQSVITYEKALVDLRLAEGVLLEELGIDFEPPEKDESISFARSIVPFIEK